MVTINYLAMLGVASVFALLLGLANHAAHAYLAMPDSWRTDIPGRSPDPAYRNADYDEAGFWEFASLRNYMIHAGCGLLFVWAIGLWYWDRQAFVLAQVCGFVAKAGITPVFCM
jgi:hypothetical protein